MVARRQQPQESFRLPCAGVDLGIDGNRPASKGSPTLAGADASAMSCFRFRHERGQHGVERRHEVGKWFGDATISCRPPPREATRLPTASNAGLHPPVITVSGMPACLIHLRLGSQRIRRRHLELGDAQPHRLQLRAARAALMPPGMPSSLALRTARRSSEKEKIIVVTSFRTKRLTAGSSIASFCMPGSISVNERTADGRRAAAASATQPPNEWPTRPPRRTEQRAPSRPDARAWSSDDRLHSVGEERLGIGLVIMDEVVRRVRPSIGEAVLHPVVVRRPQRVISIWSMSE